MCDLCYHFPCIAGCPNEIEDEPENRCYVCGEPIEGKFANICGDLYCEDCIEDMSRVKLLSIFGIEMEAAG